MLAWFLDWGEHVEFLEGLAADGREPKALRDRPALQAHLVGWWNAFAELFSDRPVHFSGVGPIPFAHNAAADLMRSAATSAAADALMSLIDHLRPSCCGVSALDAVEQRDVARPGFRSSRLGGRARGAVCERAAPWTASLTHDRGTDRHRHCVREDLFGPEGSSEGAREMISEARSIQAAYEDLGKSAKSAHASLAAEAKKLAEREAAFSRRLAEMQRALG